MDRRKFFKNGSLFTIGTTLINPYIGFANEIKVDSSKNKKAKNIIFLVSDGMSIGTLTIADTFLYRKNGEGSNWMDLYRQNKIKHAIMNTASASSIVTDSAAASSSWGSDFRVNNGSLKWVPTEKIIYPFGKNSKRKVKWPVV